MGRVIFYDWFCAMDRVTSTLKSSMVSGERVSSSTDSEKRLSVSGKARSLPLSLVDLIKKLKKVEETKFWSAIEEELNICCSLSSEGPKDKASEEEVFSSVLIAGEKVLLSKSEGECVPYFAKDLNKDSGVYSRNYEGVFERCFATQPVKMITIVIAAALFLRDRNLFLRSDFLKKHQSDDALSFIFNFLSHREDFVSEFCARSCLHDGFYFAAFLAFQDVVSKKDGMEEEFKKLLTIADKGEKASQDLARGIVSALAGIHKEATEKVVEDLIAGKCDEHIINGLFAGLGNHVGEIARIFCQKLESGNSKEIASILAEILKKIACFETKSVSGTKLSRDLLSGRGQEKYLPRFIVQCLKKKYGEQFCIDMIGPILISLQDCDFPRGRRFHYSEVVAFLAAFFPRNHTEEDLAKDLVLKECFGDGKLAYLCCSADRRITLNSKLPHFKYFATVVIPTQEPKAFTEFLLRISSGMSFKRNNSLLLATTRYFLDVESKRIYEVWCSFKGDNSKFREGLDEGLEKVRQAELERERDQLERNTRSWISPFLRK